MPIIIPGANYDFGKTMADVSLRQQALSQQQAADQQRIAMAQQQAALQQQQAQQDYDLRRQQMAQQQQQQQFQNKMAIDEQGYKRFTGERSFQTDADRYAQDFGLRKQAMDLQNKQREDTLSETKRQNDLQAQRYTEDRATREKIAGMASEDRAAAQQQKEQDQKVKALQFAAQMRRDELNHIEELYNRNPARVNTEREAQVRRELQTIESQIADTMGVSGLGLPQNTGGNQDILAEAKRRQQEAIANKRMQDQRKVAMQQQEAEDNLRKAVLSDKRGQRATTAEGYIDSQIKTLEGQGIKVTPETRQKILESIPNYRMIKDISGEADKVSNPSQAADLYGRALSGLDAPTELKDPRGQPLYRMENGQKVPVIGTYADQLRTEGGDPEELRKVFSERRDALQKLVTPEDVAPAESQAPKQWTDAERKAWEAKRMKELPLTTGIPVKAGIVGGLKYASPLAPLYWAYRGINKLTGGE